MKVAGMILGLIGALVGILGGFCSGVLGAALDEQETGDAMMGVAIGASIVGIIASIVLGASKSKKVGIAFGVVLLLCSGASFIATNFFSAPMMTLGGILGIVGVAQQPKG